MPGLAVPLRVVPSPTGLPSKRGPGLTLQILAQFKAVRFELGLVKEGYVS